MMSHPIGILAENILVPWAPGASESSKLISLVRQFSTSSSEYLMTLLAGSGWHPPASIAIAIMRNDSIIARRPFVFRLQTDDGRCMRCTCPIPSTELGFRNSIHSRSANSTTGAGTMLQWHVLNFPTPCYDWFPRI